MDNDKIGKVCQICYDNSSYTLSMTLSYSCNMRCSYCIQGQNKSNDGFSSIHELNPFLDKFIEKVKDKKNIRIIMDFLGGEITLDKDLYIHASKYLYDKLKHTENSFHVFLGTNGLDLESINDIIHSINNYIENVDMSVSISLDINRESHNKHRKIYDKSFGDPNNSYDIILSNIKKLQKTFPDICFQISSVAHDLETLTEENIEHILLNIGNLNIRTLIQNEYSDYDKRVLDRLYSILKSISIKSLEYNSKFKNRINVGDVGLSNIFKLLSNNDRFCPIDGHLFHINYDNKMYSCSCVKQNVSDKHKTLFELDEKLENDYSKCISTRLHSMCSECELSKFCRKSCYYYNEANCIPWRKIQAEYNRDYYKFLLNQDDFIDKLISYNKRIKNPGWGNIDFIEDNKEEIMRRLKYICRVK